MSKVIVTKSKLDTLADTINTKAGTTGNKTIDELAETINNYKAIPYVESLTDTTFVRLTSYLTEIPMIDTSNQSSFANFFTSCKTETIPLINTSNGTDMSYMFYNCTNLKTIPLIDTSNSLKLTSMFYNCYSITFIPNIDTSKATRFDTMFYHCEALVVAPNIDVSKSTNMNGAFIGCSLLETVPILDLSSSSDNTNIFLSCPKLKNVTFVANSIKVNISFSYSPLLTNDSINSIINGLADLTGLAAQTLTLHSSIVLTSEQTATISSKNWTLVQ